MNSDISRFHLSSFPYVALSDDNISTPCEDRVVVSVIIRAATDYKTLTD